MSARRPEMQKARAFLKYSGMALQFFVLLFIAAWGGQKLDAHFSTPKPFLTILLILLAGTGYFIKLYKDLTAEDRQGSEK